jgi:thiol-disulfide isomerase/thioredoxin
MRLALTLLAAVALTAVLVIGLTQAGDQEAEPAAPAFDLEAAQRQLADAPGPLADVYARANELLPTAEFEEQLTALDGRPVVINKWASWCGPCRSEFPIFQKVATDHGDEIAFLGVNAADSRPAAEGFLAERPLPYPSYEDPDEEIATELKVAKYFPMTLFMDRRGRTAYIKAGEYRSAADLEADIERYLGA